MKFFYTFTINLLLIGITTNSYAVGNDYLFTQLKGNYLVTYSESNDKKTISPPNIFLNNNILYNYIYEDSVLASYRPIETYIYLKKSKKQHDNYINKLYKLSQLDNKRYGSYKDRERNDGNFIIEGRYNKKSFMIIINEYGRHYIAPGVTNNNLKNRDDLFNKLPYFKAGEKSETFTPTYLIVQASKSNIEYTPDNFETHMKYEGELSLGCNKIKYEKFSILPFTGNYLINNEKFLFLSVRPLLPGVKACE